MDDFEYAKDKVLMGTERRSMAMSDKQKRETAYHEAGHTLVAMKIPDTDPVHKVTIIPRGRALGPTQQLPQEDRYSQSAQEILDRIAILWVVRGGRPRPLEANYRSRKRHRAGHGTRPSFHAVGKRISGP